MSEKIQNIEETIKNLSIKNERKEEIDKNLQKLKQESNLDKKIQIIKSIQKEINSFADTLPNNTEKQKLVEVKRQLDTFKSSLNKLRQKVKNNPNISKTKIFEVTKKMEKKGLFGKDGNGSWLKSIAKWFEGILGGFGIEDSSSNDNIAKTFEKLGYGDDEKIIKKVLKVIRKIPLDKLEEKIKNLNFKKIEPKTDNESLREKFLSLPIVKEFIDFVNEYLGDDEKINSLEEKKVAVRILKTVALNKDLIKSNGGILSKITGNIVSEFIGKEAGNNAGKTVGSVLDKMFDHGISDYFRDYALPGDGVKLFDFKKNNNFANNDLVVHK